MLCGEDSMDADAPSLPGTELGEYTALLRRRGHLVCAGVLGGLLLSVGGVLAVPETYTSVTAVQALPSGMAEFTGERSGRLAGEVNLDTEAQVVGSAQVADAVAERLGPEGAPDPAELAESIEVTVPPNSSVLEIHFSAGDPEQARRGAAAYADAYLELRGTRLDALVERQLEALREEKKALYAELDEVAGPAPEQVPGQAPGQPPGTSGDTARTEALRQEIAALGGGTGPLRALRETVEPGRVLTPATLPEEPASPRPVLWAAGGAALGLLAGLLLAVVRDRLDPRLLGTGGTGRVGGLPVLLDLSRPGRRGRKRFPGLLGEGGPDGQRVNALAHLLRVRLGARDRGPGGRVVVVAATTPGRAGAAAAVNLAAATARTGSETLLVCADPRTDTVGELLGLPEGPGLAEALMEGEDPAALEVRPDVAPRLRVLRYGRPGVSAPVQGSGTAELLDLLRGGADCVIVLVAPMSESADVHAVAPSADLVVPVVEAGRTRRSDVAELVASVSRLGAEVAGAVVLPLQPLPGPAPETVVGDLPGSSPRQEEPGDEETGEPEETEETEVVIPADTAGTRS
ncbi:chain length determinant family protein [Nocardiopsis algeriensis]|uniref:chain length determinant family protein n=1 Tax=Nocardiopsis algeriensis TaxID=1478215 RepID=UPI003B43A4C9